MALFANVLRRRVRFSGAAVVAACLAGAAAPTWAIDFGTLRLYMPAGQAAYAEITLSDKSPLDPADIRARIATKDAYGVAGMRYLPALQQVSITPQGAANGQVVLRLERLPDAGTATDIDLLLLVGDRMSLSLGEYRVNMNSANREFAAAPAGSRIAAGTPPASSSAAPATTAAVVSGSTPSVEMAARERPASPASPAAPGAFAAAQAALDAWAAAWSHRDVDAYVAAYTPDFAGREPNSARKTWLAQRRSRILSKKKISVDIDKPQFAANGDKVVVTFTQRYRGDAFAETSRKRMLLTKGEAGWLIEEEDELP